MILNSTMSDSDIACSEDLRIERLFVLDYYNLLDIGDRDMLKELYDDNSYLEWNKGVIRGVTRIESFIRGIPDSKHTIHTHSIVAVPASTDARLQGEPGYAINITGTVEFDGYTKLLFTHDFLFTYIEETVKIAIEKYRVEKIP